MSAPNWSEAAGYGIELDAFNQALLIGDDIEDICNELGRLSNEALGSSADFVADDFYGRVRRWNYVPTINAWRAENGVAPIPDVPAFPSV